MFYVENNKRRIPLIKYRKLSTRTQDIRVLKDTKFIQDYRLFIFCVLLFTLEEWKKKIIFAQLIFDIPIELKTTPPKNVYIIYGSKKKSKRKNGNDFFFCRQQIFLSFYLSHVYSAFGIGKMRSFLRWATLSNIKCQGFSLAFFFFIINYNSYTKITKKGSGI